jgi:uncharacterized HAD superfamily protein
VPADLHEQVMLVHERHRKFRYLTDAVVYLVGRGLDAEAKAIEERSVVREAVLTTAARQKDLVRLTVNVLALLNCSIRDRSGFEETRDRITAKLTEEGIHLI